MLCKLVGSPEVTSGGNALKFYASVRLDIRRKEILPDNTGIRVKVRVVKNKVAAPFKAVNLDILFGQGIDGVGCTLDAAEEFGILERKGSWYSYGGENIAQGRLNVIDYLKREPEFAAELEMKVKEALADYGKEKTGVETKLETGDKAESIEESGDDSEEADIAKAVSSSSGDSDDSFE
jgi:recombination protein RecA